MGWGFDPIFFGGRRMVAADLDRVSATRPVIVMHQSGHIVNVNSEALRRAGITRDTNVQGLVRDADGEPTGELQGPAFARHRLPRGRKGPLPRHGQGVIPCGGSPRAPGARA